MEKFSLCNRLFGLLFGLFYSAVIVNCQDQFQFQTEYEQDYNPNQVYDINPEDSPFKDMGNTEYENPPDFGSNPFPDPNQDPFSRQNQVRIN